MREASLPPISRARSKGRVRRALLDPQGGAWPYLFVAPALIAFAGFVLWPAVASWYFAFFNWDGVAWPREYVGLANFREAVGNTVFWNAFKNSWLFTLGMLLIQVPLALVVAVVLNDPGLRGRNAYRTLFFLPAVATSAVIGIVIAVMLAPVGGPVGTLLAGLGLTDRPLNLLGVAATALPTIIAVGVWKNFGIYLVYWLAGLQSVPAELYEAARMDGASSAQQLRYITLPALRPIALTIFGLALVGSLGVFDLVQSMTRGGPFFASDVMGTYIFRTAFEEGIPRFGFASAAGVLFGLTNIVVVLVQTLAVRAAGRRRGSSV